MFRVVVVSNDVPEMPDVGWLVIWKRVGEPSAELAPRLFAPQDDIFAERLRCLVAPVALKNWATPRFGVIFCQSIKAIHAVYYLSLEVCDGSVTLCLIFDDLDEKFCQFDVKVVFTLNLLFLDNFHNWLRCTNFRFSFACLSHFNVLCWLWNDLLYGFLGLRAK